MTENHKRPVRVLFVVHEGFLRTHFADISKFDFDWKFFDSGIFKAVPNSTTRLHISNIMALRLLSPEVELKLWTGFELDDELVDALNSYDYVVFNQIAAVRSFELLSKFLTHLKNSEYSAQVIFGTEGTLFKVREDGYLDDAQLKALYCDHVLLRHTARTDRQVYATEEFTSARIQEFELAIDIDTVNVPSSGIRSEERDAILLVRAPEGRKTKNNEDIDRFKALVAEDPALSSLNVEVLAPPYTSTDYWRLISRCRYLVFTSRRETFSYVFNDARAAGVISFMPAQMYSNVIGRRFSVDSYPELGERYETLADVLDKVKTYENDAQLRTNASERAREQTRRYFSIETVADNWRKLFFGENMNDNSLYLFDSGTNEKSWRQIVEDAKGLGAKFVMSYRNKHSRFHADSYMSNYDEDSGLTLVKDFLIEDAGSLYRSLTLDANKAPSFGCGLEITNVSLAEQVDFLRLVCRVNKISTVYLPTMRDCSDLTEALAEVTYFHSISAGVKPVKVVLLEPFRNDTDESGSSNRVIAGRGE